MDNGSRECICISERLIASSTSLRYYNVKLPVTLQVDASDEAIGGVLMQEGKAVCFTSHTLNDAEKQYAHIEKECLAIVTCMRKWHQYLFGKQNIIVHTDHQPLETIFKKPLGNAPRRLQRMMLQLQQYSFEVRKELYIADRLSRAPLEKIGSLELETDVVFRVELSEMDLKPTMMSDETFKKVQDETKKDPTLKQLVEVVRSGWPVDKSMLSPCLRPFWSFKEEITVYKEVLLKSHQVIIPLVLRKEMLKKIHKSHQGPDSSIRRAREVLFWPGMSAEIRQTCDACGVCAQFQVEKPKEPMMSHKVPELP